MNEPNTPSYLANAKPNPESNRAPWYKNTAPTYAGIILWFVFWQDIVNTGTPGGGLVEGIWLPIISVVVAALLCHYLFYLVPGLFGMKTGLPLYVVGSSVFGASGGIIMPGLLMGLLQFGWVAVNVYFSSLLLHETLNFVPISVIMIVWGALSAFMGLKGIQYVAKVSTYLPLIPLVILILLLSKTIGHVGDFNPSALKTAGNFASLGGSSMLGSFGIFAAIVSYVIGFFATAGAAGTDFGTNSRNACDVQKGGLTGVSLAMIFTGVAAILILCGTYGQLATAAKLGGMPMNVTQVMSAVLGENMAKTCMFLLALAAFPAACFSSLIAANSFKTMLPKVNANLSVSIGAVVAIILAITGVAGKSAAIFSFIGASFGPICGAMVADYFMHDKTWTGPRTGFNPAGWLAWAVGFIIGVLPNLGVALPLAPLCAFFAGLIVYYACSKAGMQSKVLNSNK